MKAVILAAGLGTRLLPYTLIVPKPMLPLGNKPIMEHIINWLKKSKNINHIIVCTSYLHRIIENYFEDGKRFGIKIEYSSTNKPMGTAGQLKSVEGSLMRDERFVCLYSDHIYDFNLDKMILYHRKSRASMTMAVMPQTMKLKYGFIDIDAKNNNEDKQKYIETARAVPKEIMKVANNAANTNKKKGHINSKEAYYHGNVIGWREKPQVNGLINISCYVMETKILRFIPRNSSPGMDWLTKEMLANKKKDIIKAFIVKHSRDFIDAGDWESYLEAYRMYADKPQCPSLH